jgi:hypothetical protein
MYNVARPSVYATIIPQDLQEKLRLFVPEPKTKALEAFESLPETSDDSSPLYRHFDQRASSDK